MNSIKSKYKYLILDKSRVKEVMLSLLADPEHLKVLEKQKVIKKL